MKWDSLLLFLFHLILILNLIFPPLSRPNYIMAQLWESKFTRRLFPLGASLLFIPLISSLVVASTSAQFESNPSSFRFSPSTLIVMVTNFGLFCFFFVLSSVCNEDPINSLQVSGSSGQQLFMMPSHLHELLSLIFSMVIVPCKWCCSLY